MTPVRRRVLHICCALKPALLADSTHLFPEAAARADAEVRAAVTEALEEAAAGLERWVAEDGSDQPQCVDGVPVDPGIVHSCGWDECCAEDALLRAAARVRAQKDGLV